MKVGVYIHDGFTFAPREECPYYWGEEAFDRFLDWLAACGVDVVEGCQQLGWYRYPTLPEELDRLRVRQRLVGGAHRRGLEYWQMMATNVASRLPVDQVPPGQLEIDEPASTICPRTDNGAGFRETAELSRYFARCFRGADAFELIAGDWGGCRCGECGVEQYVDYVRYHAEHLAAEQPGRMLWANLWSIAAWGPRDTSPPRFPLDSEWRRFWDGEIANGNAFLARLETLPANVGVSFPLHHWYRGFCQQSYTEEELPDWPDLPLLAGLRRSGRLLMAWTHFIVENDPFHGDLWGTLSVRLRYIKRLCDLLAQGQFEVAMGNVYSARQALNLYAFSRFARQPHLSVETVLHEFAVQVARPDGVELLENLLVFLENRDPWEFDLPPYGRVAALPEGDVDAGRLVAALPALPKLLREDSPLLLNGAEAFARTVAEAFERAKARSARRVA